MDRTWTVETAPRARCTIGLDDRGVYVEIVENGDGVARRVALTDFGAQELRDAATEMARLNTMRPDCLTHDAAKHPVEAPVGAKGEA